MLQETVSTGRRKTAVASIRLRKGTGIIDVNGRAFEEYFPVQIWRDEIMSPLQKFSDPSKVDLVIRVRGGGIQAQVIAIRFGISRALVAENEEIRGELKTLGYLTRDSRKKERKKYGRKGARKRFQFSKR